MFPPARLVQIGSKQGAFVSVLAILLVASYWRVTQCGFVWDDDDYVTDNPLLRDAAGLLRIWFEPSSLPQYYPLVHTTFWVEYHLWGLSPLGYHVVNVLLHGLAAWAFWRLLVRLSVPGAAFAALWFAVHPMHVESVAWITERKNVLSLLLALGAAHRWIDWHDGGRPRDYAVGSAAFAGALLAKTVVATVPGALLVVLWWRDGRIARRAWLGALPWLLVGGAMGAFTAHLEATLVGASETPWQLVGSQRLQVAGRAVWFYLGTLLWPFGLCFNYPRWHLDGSVLATWSPAIGAIVAVLAAWCLRGRIGRSPLAVLLLFGGILSPALGFLDVFPFRYSFVADHFAYHASLPVIAGVAALGGARLGRLGAWIGGGVLVGSAALCTRALADYRDFEVLFRAVLHRNPGSALALANLGALANRRGDAGEARELLERCLAIDPYNHEAMVNLGVIAHRDGDRAAARSWYERAARTRPDDIHAANNLAVLLLEDGDVAAALPVAEGVVARAAEFGVGRATLGWALCESGRWQDALVEFDFVLQRQPNDTASRRRAVTCLLALGKDRPAAANALICLRHEPGDPRTRAQAATALARVLAGGPSTSAGADAVAIVRNAGVDPAALLPAIAAELQRTGHPDHAAALRAAR